MTVYLKRPILEMHQNINFFWKCFFKVFALVAMVCTFTSCGPRYADYFPYFDDGSSKPYVALVTLPENCETCFPVELADQYDWYLRECIRDQGMLFLDSNKNDYKYRFCRKDLFGNDLCAYERFQCEDFAVAVDIIEHALYDYSGMPCRDVYTICAGSCKKVLVMKVRLRIIDLQGCQNDRVPKVVHQEIFTRRHIMPERDISVRCITSCSCDAYVTGAYYTAHTRMLRDLAQRIEEVICSY